MSRILPLLFALLSQFVYAQRVQQPAKAALSHKTGTTEISANNNHWLEKEPFVNGFARVLTNNKFSFVNNRNQLICEPQFDDARNFNHSLAAVQKDGKWGFINERGQVVIPCKYEIVFDFRERITIAYIDHRWVLIDPSGQITKNIDADICYGFTDGKAKVVKGNRVGMIDLDGNIIFTGATISTPAQRQVQPVVNNAASQCPDNIDFENGNFNNWSCFVGSVDSVGTTNVITVAPSAPVANRHRIINRTNPSALDAFGLFPINPPDGSNFAVKLGNTRIGAEAERIQYAIHIPTNDSNFSIRYDYAVVLQDPGHTSWTQPRFTAKLRDSATNAYVECASFEYISTSGLPGFAQSTVDTSVIYKPWATVFISLRGRAGRTMYLEFTTADCVRRGHWGYAYVDVENACGNSIDMNFDCATGAATLDGPPGFQTYNWWNQDYTAILASGQNVTLTPAPPANTTIHLEMIPFSDFGCRDTIPVTITNTFTPHFNMSESVGICAPHQFTFYNQDIPSLTANWNFGDGTTGVGDTVTHTYALPGTYTVTLNVTLASGCNGTLQHVVTVIQPTGSLNYNGGNFCSSASISFSATSTNIDSYSWDFGDGTTLTTTQPNITHTYSLPGVYIPVLTLISNAGCQIVIPGTDTIRIEDLLAGFKSDIQPGCGNAVVDFTDTSHAVAGITSYQWNFGDGNTGTGSTISHVYTNSGTYNVQLIITSASGCRDTIVHPVVITIHTAPVAAINGPATACVATRVTFTGSAQSDDAISGMQWSSSNGDTGSGNSFSVSFTQAGNYTIQLIATTVNGCSDTTTQQITINPAPDMQQPNDVYVCEGVSTSPVIFNGSIPGTVFAWTNDQPVIGLAASGNGNIPSFTAVSNAGVTTTANISVTPTANGCPGSPMNFTITVYPIPTVAVPADQTVCNRGVTSPVIINSLTAAVSAGVYTWTNDLPAIGLAASGTGNIPSFTAINDGTTPVVAHITITPSNNGCQGAPQTFSIIVNPTPALSQPANQAVCNGVQSNTIPASATVANSNITWTNDLASIGLPATGNGDIPAFTAVNNSTAPVIAHITISAEANGCSAAPVSLAIVVNPTPDVNQPANQAVCTGTSTSLVDFTGNVNGTVFNWTNDQPSIGLAANGSGDILVFNPNNNGYTNVVANITVTPTANGCEGTPKDFSITVYPTPGMIQPLNQFQCNGEITIGTSFTSPVGGVNFTWTNSLPSIGLPASGTGNIPPFVTNNPTNTSVTATITVTPSTGTCPGIPKTFYITVDPTPDMAQPANQVVCNGEVVNATNFVGTVAGTSYSWINSNASIGLPASGTGDVPSFIAVNHTYFPVTAIIQVTGSANSCGSLVRVFTITVNPSPVVDDVSSQTVCNGMTTTAIPLTGPVSGTTFNWKNDKPSIGLPAIGNGDIPAFTAINNTNAPIIATIIVFGVSANCGQALDTLTITVNPSADVRATNNTNVCLGSSVQLSANGASQYSWTPAIGLSCVNCSNPIATPTDSIVYVVKGFSNEGCPGFDSVTLMVRRPFDMLTPPNDTMCIGGSRQLSATNAATYLWSPAAGLDHVNIANPTATPTQTTQYQVVGYDAYHCFTDTGFVTITVGPKPTVDIGANHTITNGTPVTFHPVTQNGPIVSYTWTPAPELSCSDCENPSTIIKVNTLYTVRVVNSFGCSAVDSVYITSLCPKAEVFIPNAFTPDGDGLNDVLMVRGSGITVKTFRIFNRWGEMIFEKKNFTPNDPKFGWDGKIRGVVAPPDVFVYTAEIICDNGNVNFYKGNTTILK